MIFSTLQNGHHGAVSALSTPGRNTWMITFADLMALLLAFFVLIFSMSDFDSDSLADVVTSLSSELIPLAEANRSERNPSRGLVSDNSTQLNTRAGYLVALISSRFEKEVGTGIISAVRNADDVLVSVDFAALTDSEEEATGGEFARSLTAFLETLREPIDVFVAAPQSVSQLETSEITSVLKEGEAVFQQLKRLGYTGEMSIFVGAPTSREGLNEDGSELTLRIRTGRR